MVNSLFCQLSKFALFCVCFFSFIFGVLPLKNILAFEDALEINHSYLNQENFLDLKSYQFNKLREEKWFQSRGGWRLTGGSLGMDLLYTQLEVRLPHPLSKETTVIFLAKQQELYEIKPFRYQVEVDWRPHDLAAFSLLGMPEYDKRKADQGASFTIGKRPWNYLRLQKLFHNLYYNEKNFYDNSYYSQYPIENYLEGSIRINKWFTRFSHLLDKPVKQIFPKQELTVTYKGQDSCVVSDYHYGEQSLAGLTWRSFDIRKRRETTVTTDDSSPNNRDQQLLYSSIDFYLLHPLSEKLHGTIGVREDRFQNIFRQLDLPIGDYDFHLWTAQLYGILRHKTESDRYWEYGLYAGDTDKVTDYLSTERQDKTRRKNEAKLRISWEFQDPSKHSALMLTTSWNMDNFFNNFWDGGNISYQQTF
jgi:hypothetical protein